jgi:hypothetical protein
MNRSPLPEGGHIKKEISALWNRKMARLCAKWSATTVWLVNTQARQLTELYRALRLYVNCFQPSMKLLSKERDGKKIRCVYDPAKTPREPAPAVRDTICPEAARTNRGGRDTRSYQPLKPTQAAATGCVPLCRQQLS